MGRLEEAFLDTPLLLRRVGGTGALEPELKLHTGILNVFEVVHYLMRHNAPAAGRTFDALLPFSQDLTRSRILEASRLRVRVSDRGLSYADAAGYVTAREMGLPFLTTDRGFAGLAGARLVPA